MLFERRAYKLRPGAAPEFWALQREWNTPRGVPRYLERCIGYFETIAGAASEIVHYYRYDSYEDWRSRLFGLYTPERMPYFAAARGLLIAQDNMFMDPAGISGALPLWSGERDWLPGTPAYSVEGRLENVFVVETMLDLIPGGMPAFVEASAGFADDADGREHATTIGTFAVTTGQLHRIMVMRWYPDAQAAERHRQGAEASKAWQEFRRRLRPWVAAERTAHMKLSPVEWMRPLFQRIDWG